MTQFYYTIQESTGDAGGFTLQAISKDNRKVTYQGKLEGDELQIGTRPRPAAAMNTMVAHRAPAGEGAYPERLPLPALHKVPDNGLAKTPPMGWNSWNKFRRPRGRRRGAGHGRRHGVERHERRRIRVHQYRRHLGGRARRAGQHPDQQEISGHEGAGRLCARQGAEAGDLFFARAEHLRRVRRQLRATKQQDAKTWAAWGIDYLKYDWCGARNIYTDEEMQAVYQKMGDALHATGRPIVFSLCQYGSDDVWKWGAEVGGNLWRTTGDIRDSGIR